MVAEVAVIVYVVVAVMVVIQIAAVVELGYGGWGEMIVVLVVVMDNCLHF